MGVKVRKKKGDTAYWVFINHDGRRKAKRIGDKKAAELVATKLRARLADGDPAALETPAADQTQTVREYAKQWLKTEVAQTCKFSTLKSYETAIERHILPVLGDRPLTAISRTDCKTVISVCRLKPVRKDSQRTLSPKTVGNICRALGSMLSQAVDDGLIPANPALRLNKHYKRRQDEPQREICALTVEELRAFLTKAQEHAPREYPLFLCAVLTGMRLGELIGLQWGDIDFQGGFVVVRRGRVLNRTTTPKNHKTRRIDMADTLADALKELQQARRAETLKKGWGEVPEWVFCSETGAPLDANNLRKRVFYRVLEKAGLRRIRMHDLRHTYCSLLLAQGESIAYIRDQLGHSSIQLTVDTYGHLIPGANKNAVDRLADAIKRNPTATSGIEAHG